MRLALITVLLAASFGIKAAPVDFRIMLTVTSGYIVECTSLPLGHWECSPGPDAAGNIYYGGFGIDDSILENNGFNKQGLLYYFWITMEDNTWGYNYPTDNSFAGFRGPAGFDVSPGFDVVGGTIVDIRGGVFGTGDIPFVDFSGGSGEVVPGCVGAYCGSTSNQFSAVGWRVPPEGGTVRYADPEFGVRGTLHIVPVPLPTAGWLLVSAFGAVAALRRRSTSSKASC